MGNTKTTGDKMVKICAADNFSWLEIQPQDCQIVMFKNTHQMRGG